MLFSGVLQSDSGYICVCIWVCAYIYIHTLRFFSHLFHFKSRINVLLYWSISRRLAPVFEFYLSLCSIFPCGSAGKESACNTGDMGSITWLGKIPWRRERLPTPEFWPGEFHRLYSPWGRIVRHAWETFTFMYFLIASMVLLLLCWVIYRKQKKQKKKKEPVVSQSSNPGALQVTSVTLGQ